MTENKTYTEESSKEGGNNSGRTNNSKEISESSNLQIQIMMDMHDHHFDEFGEA